MKRTETQSNDEIKKSFAPIDKYLNLHDNELDSLCCIQQLFCRIRCLCQYSNKQSLKALMFHVLKENQLFFTCFMIEGNLAHDTFLRMYSFISDFSI